MLLILPSFLDCRCEERRETELIRVQYTNKTVETIKNIFPSTNANDYLGYLAFPFGANFQNDCSG